MLEVRCALCIKAKFKSFSLPVIPYCLIFINSGLIRWSICNRGDFVNPHLCVTHALSYPSSVSPFSLFLSVLRYGCKSVVARSPSHRWRWRAFPLCLSLALHVLSGSLTQPNGRGGREKKGENGVAFATNAIFGVSFFDVATQPLLDSKRTPKGQKFNELFRR